MVLFLCFQYEKRQGNNNSLPLSSKEYRFNIINMMKPDSLYNAGMKPLLYSESNAKNKSKSTNNPILIEIGWYRDGYDICYYQNNMKRKNGGFYYTLTFAVKFESIFLSSLYFYKMITIASTLHIAIPILILNFAII